MQYKITRQSEKDIETFFAEFNDMHDALIFIQAKVNQDDQLRMKRIYRLFENGNLKKDFNTAGIAIDYDLAPYAEEDKDISATTARPYKVQESGTTTSQFIDLNDAKLFIDKKISLDRIDKKDILYRLMNENQVVEQRSQSTEPQDNASSSRSSTTPFGTSPKPPGTISTQDDDD